MAENQCERPPTRFGLLNSLDGYTKCWGSTRSDLVHLIVRFDPSCCRCKLNFHAARHCWSCCCCLELRLRPKATSPVFGVLLSQELRLDCVCSWPSFETGLPGKKIRCAACGTRMQARVLRSAGLPRRVQYMAGVAFYLTGQCRCDVPFNVKRKSGNN